MHIQNSSILLLMYLLISKLFETKFFYATLADLVFTRQPRLASKTQSSCLSLPIAGNAGMCRPAKLTTQVSKARYSPWFQQPLGSQDTFSRIRHDTGLSHGCENGLKSHMVVWVNLTRVNLRGRRETRESVAHVHGHGPGRTLPLWVKSGEWTLGWQPVGAWV